jgi:hypothetical protein
MQKLRKEFISLLLVVALLFPGIATAQSEEETLSLRVTKIFGFRVGNRLQGRFRLSLDGPEDLDRVEFYMDDVVIHEDQEAPFKFEFDTGEVSPGEHTLKAIGYTKGGKSIPSQIGTYEILTPDEAFGNLQKFVLPILIGVVVLLAVAGIFSSIITRRRGKQRIGEYGPAGGAVCKRCGLPFSRHVLSPNLLVGKLERCPNCGAILIVRRGTPMELREAEARLKAELQKNQMEPEPDEEERLRRLIDDSRFEQ